MDNIIENDGNVDSVPLIGKTIRHGDKSTSLTIPKECVKALGIESSKVSMSLLNDFDGGKHLLVTKYHREITIE